MSHPEQMAYVRLVHQAIGSAGSVIEIGSLDHNGSVRSVLTSATEYVGVDLAEGPGVDLVAAGQEVDLPDDHFDTAISCECFEHNPYWRETFTNMIRMTRPGGLVVMTCASKGRLEHGTQRTFAGHSIGSQSLGWDYYLNLTQADFEREIQFGEHFSVWRFFYIASSHDLYFYGFKKGAEPRISAARLAELDAEIPKLNGLKKKVARNPIVNLTRKAGLLPVEIARHVMDEKRFQDFAVPYMRMVDGAKRRLGRR